MTTFYGPWRADSTNGFRCKLDLTYTVSSDGATATVTADLSIQTQYYASDSGVTWSFSGGIVDSDPPQVPFNHSGSNQITLISRRTKAVALSYSGATTFSVSGSLGSVTAVAGTATVSGSISLPARTVGAPGPPTGVTVARVSDSTQNLAWSLPAVNAAAPVEGVQIERQDSTANVWYSVAKINGRPTSWQDASTIPNRRYLYRVRTVNGSESDYRASAWVQVGPIETTPAAPSNVSAQKQANGDIKVTWTQNVYYALAAQTIVEDTINDGATWTVVATLAGDPTTWTHTSPSTTGAHRYRVQVKTASPVLSSAYSPVSNAVALLAAPNAPTDLTPNGQARDANKVIVVSWRHNPVDTTAQTKRQVRWRYVGSSTWTTGSEFANATQDATFASGTFANGQTLEWQVRTWGSHADPSPWSATATIALSTAPVPTITSPGPTLDTSRITVAWSFFDAEGQSQSQWRATLKDSTGQLLEVKSGSGATNTTSFAAYASNGATYTVVVEVADSVGTWSDPVSRTFTVAYAPPATPTVAAAWMPDSGAVAVTVTAGLTTTAEVATSYIEVSRSANGDDWRVIASNLSPEGGTVVDPLPAIGGLTYYRAVAVSVLASTATSAPAIVDSKDSGVDCYVWINGGPGFRQSIRLASNVTISDSPARAKEIVGPFDGQSWPVEFAGQARSLVIQVRADLWREGVNVGHRSSTPAEIAAMTDLPGPHAYRDPEGVREFGSLAHDGLSGRGVDFRRPVGLTLTKTLWTEPEGTQS